MLKLVLAAVLAGSALNAHAGFFFFFIPGSVIGKVSDALTGAQGNQCVKSTTKVGDVLGSSTGNTATVLSLSGTSSRCVRPEFPIRAAVQFNYSFSSETGMVLPDGFEQKPIGDFARFNGQLLQAENGSRMGVSVFARPRLPSSTLDAIAQGVSGEMARLVEDYSAGEREHLTINGTPSVRFEATAKNKGFLGPKFTYVVTVLEGDKEMLVLNAFAPWKEDFHAEREKLQGFAYTVKGLRTTDTATTQASPAVATVPVIAPAPVAASVASVSAPPQSERSESQQAAALADRLRSLDSLYKSGLITREEFDGKRKQLLDSL